MPDPAATLTVRVTTRAARDEVGAPRDGMVAVRVTAPPAEGRANDAVTKLVARAAGVAPSRVSITRGTSARVKTLRVEGIGQAELDAAIRRSGPAS